jgi:hypothetical protein
MSDAPTQWTNIGHLALEPSEDGMWVLLTDYEALASRLAEVEAERDEARKKLHMVSFMGEGYALVEKRAMEAEAHADALQREVERLREAANVQTIYRAQHWLRRHMTAPEDAEVEVLCERHGYGAVMDAASRLWARKPHGSGAFYVGGCIGFTSDEEARAALDTRSEQGEG